jgi:hypothetical protein
MPDINTLVPDILALFKDGRVDLSLDGLKVFSEKVSTSIRNKMVEERPIPSLRMSNIGKPCERQLWYNLNAPEQAEQLPPEALIKFMYGHILEDMLLYLAREAGHTVEYEQHEIDLCGVKGHLDCVIDGFIVDVKSCSTYGFEKFRVGLTADTDSFGYRSQLDGYLTAAPAGVDRSVGYFLAIDKQLGRLCLSRHVREDKDFEEFINRKRRIVRSKTPPPRGFSPEPDGASGNMKLSVECSYCPFKKVCYPEARTFLYSTGPRYLTTVRSLPRVPEV